MREIKFRHWDKEQKVMNVQGDPDLETLQSFIFHYGDQELMQFTGFYDEDGKEIYENDLILIKPKPMSKGYVGKVLYVNATFEVEAKEFLHKEYRRLSYYINNPFSVEVIGNVHENSNLL